MSTLSWKVADGRQLVDKSGHSLQEIITTVEKVSDIVAEIAAASHEQASGIKQVNKAVTLMDEMMQQNAALVEEIALTEGDNSQPHFLPASDYAWSPACLLMRYPARFIYTESKNCI
jgi:hypothetical protein